MIDFNLSSASHIFTTLICIFIIIFLPRLFVNKNDAPKQVLIMTIISLILINQGMDFYREGIMDDWKLGLPLHLCDFSSASIILYFITKKGSSFYLLILQAYLELEWLY